MDQPDSSSPRYVMPPAQVGPCLWFQAPGGEPHAAVITRVGIRTVDVTIFIPGARGGVSRTGTRHAADPEFPKLRSIEGGVWDYTPDQVALRALVDVFATDLGQSPV